MDDRRLLGGTPSLVGVHLVTSSGTAAPTTARTRHLQRIKSMQAG